MVFQCRELDRLPVLVALAVTGTLVPCEVAAAVTSFVVPVPCLTGVPFPGLERRWKPKHPTGEGSFITKFLEPMA